jgi:hypothetical protein
MPKIAVYVQRAYNKPTYAQESYNVRQFGGVELVRDALVRAGFEVGYCDYTTVGKYDYILVSITAPIDWYSFISERVKWGKIRGRVICGGFGVMNIRPFLEYADAFVFGRGEGLIVPLITSYGERFTSVCYSRDFSLSTRYEIAQADRPYPYPYQNARGDMVCESVIGCPRKCTFCQYTWTRRYTGRGEQGEYNTWAATTERTIFDFDLSTPEAWTTGGKPYVIIGVDGSSERLRRMVNKPISDDLLRAFIVASVQATGIFRVKMFNLVGLPTETEEDWGQLVRVFQEANREIKKTADDRPYFVFEITNNHFDPDPCTPLAPYPGEYCNLRDLVAETVRVTPSRYPHKVFDGTRIRLLYQQTIETLPTKAVVYAAIRGEERDAVAIRRLACTKRFWSAVTKDRLATVEGVLDVSRLFGTYTWDTLPTRYLQGPTSNEKMSRIADRLLRKFGGERGASLADSVRGDFPLRDSNQAGVDIDGENNVIGGEFV